MRLTPQQVERAAELAGLDLDQDELRTITTQLDELLQQFSALRAVVDDAAAAPPAAAAAPPVAADRLTADPYRHTAGLRSDVPGADLLQEPPHAWAPQWADGTFVVPLLQWAAGSPPREAGPDAGPERADGHAADAVD